MKDCEKKTIKELWMRGFGSTRISKVLGISVNTVKSYCRRHGYSGDRQQVPKTETNNENAKARCKYCGISFFQKNGTKKKCFCSDKCRMAWWNSHQDLVKRKAVYIFVCKNCGKEFQAYGNKQRKYCSHQCYIRHRYEKI